MYQHHKPFFIRPIPTEAAALPHQSFHLEAFTQEKRFILVGGIKVKEAPRNTPLAIARGK
jgi:hypothetical protein